MKSNVGYRIYSTYRQVYDLASHTSYVGCINFLREWQDLHFNIDSERKIFKKFFNNNFIYSQNFCQKSTERKIAEKIFFFYIFLMRDLGYEPELYVL